MPLSNYLLIFRRKSEIAVSAACRPQQRPMHSPAPHPPPARVGAAVVEEPLLGLKGIADQELTGEYGRRCVRRGGGGVFSVCAASASHSSSSSAGSDRGGGAVLRTKKGNGDQPERVDGAEAEEVEEDDGPGEEDDERCCWASYGRRRVRRLPPPITVVAKALRKRCVLPWVLRRSYEDGGRLVMRREVKAEDREYLQPSRQGGRLTLKLVHVHERAPPPAGNSPASVTAPTAPVPLPAPALHIRRRQQQEKEEEEAVQKAAVQSTLGLRLASPATAAVEHYRLYFSEAAVISRVGEEAHQLVS